MIGLHRRRTLRPGEIFPADEKGYRVAFPRLRSGLKIRVVERGDPAAPPVLLVHGWACDAYVFRYNMPALADAGYRAVAIDLKGHGLSDKPTAAHEYTIDALVEHLAEVLDALELDSVALAGHSLGGSLVYHFALRYPQRARCVGLLSPVGLSGVPLMWLYKLVTPAFLAPLIKHVRSRTVVKIALRRVYGRRGHYTQRDVEEFLAPSRFPEYAVALRQLLHHYDWNAAEHRPLGIVDLPAVGVWGNLDHMMPGDGMTVYLPLLPQIVLRTIPEAGHLITEETPDEVNDALVGLLRRASV
jgi:pimeloyl-ACP methyl ester carboxylesterase